jgi:hypothetical protein
LLGCGVCSGTLGNARGYQDVAELGEHVLEGGFGLGVVPGLGVAACGDAGRAMAVPGVPDDDQGVDEQRERDGALDGAAGAVAGLAGAQDVAGVGEGLLDGPAGGVAGDQGGGAGGQVGGDQGEQAGVVAAGEDDPDGLGVQAAVPQTGDVGQVDVLVTAVDLDRGGGSAGGGGQLVGGA